MSEVEQLRKEIEVLREQLRIQNEILQVERQNLIRLFDNSSGFVAFMQGPEFVYTYVNPAHKKIVKADFTGRSILEAAPQAKNLHSILRKVYETGEPFIHHKQQVTISGVSHYMNANYVASRDEKGDIIGIIAWGIDISEQVNANDALKAERSLREKFVLALTHDLRTPLTSMKLVAQMLGRQVDDPQYVAKSSERMVKSINHSERMILNLLDANRIQIGEKLPHKVDECLFDQIVEEALTEIATVHGDRFDFQKKSGSIKGLLDSTAMRRVVENLIENAVKYSFVGSKITVTLKLENDVIEFSVHNDGFPISTEDQKRVFIPYERTESARDSDQRGWGIGLALVKAIVESHDGSIHLNSSEKDGTTFFVRVPHRV